MADPVVTAIPVDVWTKVATNVTTGMIYPLKTGGIVHVQTIRDTGGGAPTNGDLSEAVPIPDEGAAINSSAGIDVYIAVVGDVAGSVRADL